MTFSLSLSLSLNVCVRLLKFLWFLQRGLHFMILLYNITYRRSGHLVYILIAKQMHTWFKNLLTTKMTCWDAIYSFDCCHLLSLPFNSGIAFLFIFWIQKRKWIETDSLFRHSFVRPLTRWHISLRRPLEFQQQQQKRSDFHWKRLKVQRVFGEFK